MKLAALLVLFLSFSLSIVIAQDKLYLYSIEDTGNSWTVIVDDPSSSHYWRIVFSKGSDPENDVKFIDERIAKDFHNVRRVSKYIDATGKQLAGEGYITISRQQGLMQSFIENVLSVFSGMESEAGLILYIFLCLMTILVFIMLGLKNMLFWILGIAGVTALFYIPSVISRTGGGSFPVFIPVAIIALFIIISVIESKTGGER